jgi:hypothetical protein
MVLEVKYLMDKPSILKSDRKRIMELFNGVRREVVHNIPYQLELFQEAVEHTTTHAQIEIDALASFALAKAGAAALEKDPQEFADKWLAMRAPPSVGTKRLEEEDD